MVDPLRRDYELAVQADDDDLPLEEDDNNNWCLPSAEAPEAEELDELGIPVLRLERASSGFILDGPGQVQVDNFCCIDGEEDNTPPFATPTPSQPTATPTHASNTSPAPPPPTLASHTTTQPQSQSQSSPTQLQQSQQAQAASPWATSDPYHPTTWRVSSGAPAAIRSALHGSAHPNVIIPAPASSRAAAAAASGPVVTIEDELLLLQQSRGKQLRTGSGSKASDGSGACVSAVDVLDAAAAAAKLACADAAAMYAAAVDAAAADAAAVGAASAAEDDAAAAAYHSGGVPYAERHPDAAQLAAATSAADDAAEDTNDGITFELLPKDWRPSAHSESLTHQQQRLLAAAESALGSVNASSGVQLGSGFLSHISSRDSRSKGLEPGKRDLGWGGMGAASERRMLGELGLLGERAPEGLGLLGEFGSRG
ncbi:MAG: hypothetical protein WDW36_000841 [Sanguina aurantia]